MVVKYMEDSKEIDLFLSDKRALKNEKARRRHWKLEKAKREKRQETEASFGKRSQIIKMLAETYQPKCEIEKGKLTLNIPSTFSIIDSPEYAIATVGMFSKSVREHRIRSVYFNHKNLALYDLAANGLLDLVAVELKMEASRTRRKIRWHGRFPTDENIQRFIRALGIIKHLGLEKEYPKETEAADLRVFDIRNRHYFRVLRPDRADYKTIIVGRFADHINQCLGDHNKELTVQARHKLCEYTGEILDNAEEHSNMLDWTIQGYLDNSLDTPICEIAIFNTGDTIAQTLKSLPKQSYTWQQIAPYMSHHRKSLWFGPSWSEEDLLTLIALQGHVSSKNESATDTRGNGTVDLIEFFQQIHAECKLENNPIAAKMAILSGGTHILFDGTYKLRANKVGGGKVIAFNAANDLNQKPDAQYVRGLKGFNFPGTVISVRFPLATTSTTEAEVHTDG